MRNRITTAIAIFAIAASSTFSVAGQTTFPANAGTLGAVADGPAAQCGTAGPNKDVTFTVSGISGAPSAVSANFTFGAPVHTWRGDITATLIAPNGASHVLFGRTNSTTAAGCGSPNDLAGPYTFNDTGLTTWWTIAGTPTPTGTYRTTTPGGSAAGGTVTTMNPAFAGIPTSNGTWTLRFTDAGGGDTGSVSAANLTLTAGGPPAPVQHVVDYNGDGRTDWSVVRNTGGGSGGQVTWFNQPTGGGSSLATPFGISTDFFVPEDYDGDGSTDIAVWRPGAATVAAWYILQSQTNTLRAEAYGVTGDDPTVVGDYNNDGRADLAVYRAGASAGAQSFWYYRTTANGTVTVVPWGTNGDFPAPGDYDGNGSNDFVVQRPSGAQGRFFTLLSTGATSSTVYGTSSDLILPGDYDGDGKTDICVARGTGGQILWSFLSSLNGSSTSVVWGLSATDFPVQGDYDGDGRTDRAVWRPAADPTQNFFFVDRSTGAGLLAFEWGQNGDYPVANYNSH